MKKSNFSLKIESNVKSEDEVRGFIGQIYEGIMLLEYYTQHITSYPSTIKYVNEKKKSAVEKSVYLNPWPNRVCLHFEWLYTF